jgi:hypothetical protein
VTLGSAVANMPMRVSGLSAFKLILGDFGLTDDKGVYQD